MAYFNQAMKSEMKNRLETFFPTWKFSIRVRHHSSVVVSILRADDDIFSQVMDALKNTNEADVVEHYEKLGIYDISYFSCFLDKAKWSNNEELKKKMSLLHGILCLEDHPEYAYFCESNSMEDYSRVAYYKSLWLGDNYNQKPFEYRPAKVKKAAKVKVS